MTRLVRWLLLVAAVVAPAPSFAQSASTPDSSPFQVSGLRLACFSPQRAFTESSDGKAGITRLTTLQNERAREIAERNKTLESMQQGLERSGAVLSEFVRAQRAKEIEKFELDVKRFIEDAQAELMGVQRDIENSFLVKLKPAVDQVAKEKGLHLIFSLDSATLVWAAPALDITPDVVKLLALAETPNR